MLQLSSSLIVSSPIIWAWADLLASCFHTLAESRRFSRWLWHKIKQSRHAQQGILQILPVFFFNSKEVNYRFHLFSLPLTPHMCPFKMPWQFSLQQETQGADFSGTVSQEEAKPGILPLHCLCFLCCAWSKSWDLLTSHSKIYLATIYRLHTLLLGTVTWHNPSVKHKKTTCQNVMHLQQHNSLIALWSVLMTLMLNVRNVFLTVWLGAKQRTEL